ncbi:hypothetical protein AWB78_07556 [Caballeronia calidae]|uniref:Macro domain-containing protein n=1 Tax=Caballeronia calidae TaxID=1777139 RepID=A0A158EF72_9BURK|nr:hypothetical protein [Caballeronia calidae]SAL05541.1 hypothetical protein AWB78_07556 [Caballeronia calidae]
MTWFKQVFGFNESTYEETQKRFHVESEQLLTDSDPPRRFHVGTLSVPSLDELRAQMSALSKPDGTRLTLRTIVANAYALHTRPEANGALIQVASQFNLLEMVGPGVAPEDGITRYRNDFTQGPACAMACAPATVFRNYLASVDGQQGQTRDHQINTLHDLDRALGISGIQMQNGYALLDPRTVRAIGQHIRGLDESERDALRKCLRIGLHSDTEVTADGAPPGQRVTQALCSALPVADWAPFASLVLEASYEAAVLAAVLNHRRTGNARVFLTMVGGGAFGNERAWIIQAVRRALRFVHDHPLDVVMVCFGKVSSDLAELAAEIDAGV